MAHQITPIGKWRKEVSWNDPEVMYAPDGGHMNNQITPEEYVIEQDIEMQGTSVLDEKTCKISSKKVLEKLRTVMTDNYCNYDYEQRLQMLAANKPSVGGFFNMGASQELDYLIQAAKETGQLNSNNDFQQPVAGSQIHVAQGSVPSNSMIANMDRIMNKTPVHQPQPQQRPIQMQPTQILQTAMANQPQQVPKITPKKIKANREQLKNLLSKRT